MRIHQGCPTVLDQRSTFQGARGTVLKCSLWRSRFTFFDNTIGALQIKHIWNENKQKNYSSTGLIACLNCRLPTANNFCDAGHEPPSVEDYLFFFFNFSFLNTFCGPETDRMLRVQCTQTKIYKINSTQFHFSLQPLRTTWDQYCTWD